MNRRIAILTAALALGYGCATYQPPERPMAFMVPTLTRGGNLENLHRLRVSPEILRSHLEEQQFWEPLRKAGLEESELETVSRGLRLRGYAELDARRTASPLQWVMFFGSAPDELTVIGGYGPEGTDRTARKVWKVE